MHLTTTNPVPGVWRQNTRAGVILAISFTRLSRRNARISAHTMRMRAYARIPAHAMRMRAYARISAHAMRMRAYARIPAHAMRMRAFLRMRCECAHFAHAMRMLAHARISPHAMRCDAMRMRACDAMRMRASRGDLCVSGTVYIYIYICNSSLEPNCRIHHILLGIGAMYCDNRCRAPMDSVISVIQRIYPSDPSAKREVGSMPTITS